MEIKELVDDFISHSPGFENDSDLPDIDEKHSEIVKAAYGQFYDRKEITLKNFRNWAGQSDTSVPLQLTKKNIINYGLLNFTARYCYYNLFKRREQKFNLSNILDDISILKSIGSENILKDNPVDETPGSTLSYSIDETSVNPRWLRYLYIYSRMKNLGLISDGDTWVDVGSYYGGIQGLVRKYYPKTRIVMVDFHHQLCRGYIYLKTMYPSSSHMLPDEVENLSSFDDVPDGSFVYVPAGSYEKISKMNADLVTNFYSLGEMRREVFNTYMNSPLFKNSEKQYLVNRVVSAPFFEKTYDSDLTVWDYKLENRRVDYFDIFPMSHYMIIKRELFGKSSFRNISSPYFELVTSND